MGENVTGNKPYIELCKKQASATLGQALFSKTPKCLTRDEPGWASSFSYFEIEPTLSLGLNQKRHSLNKFQVVIFS